MKLDFPEEVLKILEQTTITSPPANLLFFLQWATSKPKKLVQILDEYHKLNAFGKKEFLIYTLKWKMAPDEALQRAKQYQKFDHLKRQNLAKATHRFAKGLPFLMEMPNGVLCEITKISTDNYFSPHYIFKFMVQGVTVRVEYSYWWRFSEAISYLLQGKVPPCNILQIRIGEISCPPYTPAGKTILEAINNNVNPFVNALISERKKLRK